MPNPDTTSKAKSHPLSYGSARRNPLLTFLRAHKLLSATSISIIAIAITWSYSASLRGSVAARIDVARGHYEVHSFGLPARWRPQYAQLLHDRYGIELRIVAGCVVTQSEVDYTAAYNAVAYDAAIRHFGHNIFSECATDARKAYEKSLGPQPNSTE